MGGGECFAACLGSPTQGLSQGFVFQNPADCLGNFFRGTVRQNGTFAVFQHVRHTADFTCDDGKAGAHGLDQRHGHSLVSGGQQEQVGILQIGVDVALASQEVYAIGKAQGFCQSLGLLQKLTVPQQVQPGVEVLFVNQGKGVKKTFVIFLFVKPADMG